jgi:hypothetical protein
MFCVTNIPPCYSYFHLIGGVMVTMLVSFAVDRGVEPWLDQSKENLLLLRWSHSTEG